MTTIPHNREPFLDASGLVARSWRTYLSSLTQSDAATQLQRQIDQLRAAIPTESPTAVTVRSMRNCSQQVQSM
ncbi:hypothetical protein [Xylella fastidiosa]|uniref:hypothetical protein n=1 Tax=Xylella fastidiosa TaxID=2371 RepID=UPI0039854066